ncbi:MAG TPA: hypothetical protein VFS20_09165 [Longimicrobium sp.]|nr:hypothetical protein [Longimicrobium sp.]
MHLRTLSLALLASASLAACGTTDLAVTGPEQSPAEPRGNHTANYCVRFNVPPVGTVFGSSVPNPPGSVVFVEQSIPVSVNKFITSAGTSAYNGMRIEPAPGGFGLAAGNTDHTVSVNAGFNFTFLPFVPTQVVFHFFKPGGYENLRVNGSPIWVGPITAPPGAIGGVAVASAWAPTIGGVQGTVTLTGAAITDLWVGGTNLWIDTVCAY